MCGYVAVPRSLPHGTQSYFPSGPSLQGLGPDIFSSTSETWLCLAASVEPRHLIRSNSSLTSLSRSFAPAGMWSRSICRMACRDLTAPNVVAFGVTGPHVGCELPCSLGRDLEGFPPDGHDRKIDRTVPKCHRAQSETEEPCQG